MVYGAAVKTTETTLRTLFGEEEVETVETYTGSTEPTLKTRVQGHLTSFRYEKYRHSTRLSRYIHSLKDEDKQYSIEWKIIDKQKSFSSISNTCRLCLAECYFILYGDSGPNLLEIVQNNYVFIMSNVIFNVNLHILLYPQ